MSQVRAAGPVDLTAAAELPNCISSCGLKVLTDLGCTLGDACYCDRSGTVFGALTACAIGSCPTMPDLLEEIRFQGSSCDWTIHQDAGLTAKAILITFLILATLIVSARLASRRSRWGGAGYRWDDGRCL